MDTNFGTSTPYSLGVEEEFQLVDAETFELVSGIEPILAALRGEAIGERVKPELMQSVVEVSTRIAANVEEAVDDLVDLRARLIRAAADEGAAIASAGTHPFSRYEQQAITDRPRYTELAERSAGARPAIRSSACTSTSVSAPRRRRSPARTGCATTCRSCSRCRRTPLSGRAGRPDSRRRARRSSATSPAAACRRPWLVRAVRARRGERRPYRLLPRLHAHLVGRPATAALGTVEIRICDAQTHVANVAALAALSSRSSPRSAAPSSAARSRPRAPTSCSRRTAGGRRGTGSTPGSSTSSTTPSARRRTRSAPSSSAASRRGRARLRGGARARRPDPRRGNGAHEQLPRLRRHAGCTAVARWLSEQTVPSRTAGSASSRPYAARARAGAPASSARKRSDSSRCRRPSPVSSSSSSAKIAEASASRASTGFLYSATSQSRSSP